MVTAIDIIAGKYIHVTKEEFTKNENLVSLKTKRLTIYNQNNEVIFSLPSSKFWEFMNTNNLPANRFLNSAKDNGLPLSFTFIRKCDETLAKNKGHLKYQGWYAKYDSYLK